MDTKKDKEKKASDAKPVTKEAAAKPVAREVGSYQVRTKLDELLELVNQKEQLVEAEAMDTLGLDLVQLKEYAKILEDAKLLVVHYPPLGATQLWSKEYGKKLKEKKQKKKPEKKKKGSEKK
jgi:hypothetical protein